MDFNNAELKKISKDILVKLNLTTPIYNTLIKTSQENALNKLRKLVNDSNLPEVKENNQKKILFNLVRGIYSLPIYIESGLAKALQHKGHDVKMLTCGKALSMCTCSFTVNMPPNQWSCKNCNDFSTRFFDTVGLPYSTYNKYLSDREILDISGKVNKMNSKDYEEFSYNDVNVGYHAYTSTQRYFKGEKSSKDMYEKIFRLELSNAMISTIVAKGVIKEYDPDILVTSHGCYSPWGSFVDYFRNKGKKVCVYGTGYRKDTISFDLDKIDESFKKYIKDVKKNKGLNDAENRELSDFMTNRTKGTGKDDTSKYGFEEQKEEKMKKQFKFEKYKKSYAIFPNVAWDSSLIRGSEEAFESVYEWVSHTIDFFRENPDLQLIIKIHPGERIHESKKTLLDYINQKYSSIPKNIKILPPETNISAYALFPFITAGIMYTGTLCVEMALNEIPVIMVGKSRYSNKSFTNFVSTKEDYDNILKRSPSQLSKEDVDLAKSYAYFYFIKNFVPLDFIYYNNFLDLGWKIDSLDQLDPSKDRYLDHLCEYITGDKIYQTW